MNELQNAYAIIGQLYAQLLEHTKTIQSLKQDMQRLSVEPNHTVQPKVPSFESSRQSPIQKAIRPTGV